MAPQDVLFLDGCLLDVIEVREVFRQIRVAFRLNAPLFGPLAARCAFTIPAVYLIDDGHPGDDLTKWRETLAVQARVVLEIDEYLRGSRVGRPTHRVGDKATLVAPLDLIDGNSRVAPSGGDGWIAVDAELHHEIGDHAEEAAVVVEPVLNQVIETIRAVWRPIAVHLDDEGAGARVERHFVRRGCRVLENRRILECRAASLLSRADVDAGQPQRDGKDTHKARTITHHWTPPGLTRTQRSMFRILSKLPPQE